MAFRIFTNPRRSMQRSGFLKHLVWRASLSATNDISTLGRNLITAVSRKLSLCLTAHLQEYIMNALTSTKYRAIRLAASDFSEHRADKVMVQIEIQDAYLADPGLPSRRGKLIGDDWNRYPYLALDLGLIRSGTYSLLVRGQSFLSLVPEEERKAFTRTGPMDFNENLNPFKLDVSQRLLLLFSFIERDGDVLKRLYSKLLPKSGIFDARDVGNYLPDIYRGLARESQDKIRSGDDRLRIQRILDTADNIEAVKQKSSPGGKNPREHAITIRLEPFVDLGLLAKPDPFAYRYQITDSTNAVFEPFNSSEDVDFYLQHHFFGTSNEAFGLNSEHIVAKEESLNALQKAYSILKSPLGYAPILEVCLLAGIHSINELGVYFEICEAIDVLKILQKRKPNLVRFNVDRMGALTFVKFIGDIVGAMED